MRELTSEKKYKLKPLLNQTELDAIELASEQFKATGEGKYRILMGPTLVKRVRDLLDWKLGTNHYDFRAADSFVGYYIEFSIWPREAMART